MFGPILDYWLLRPFTHSRRYESEEQLDTRFSDSLRMDTANAIRRVEKLQTRLRGRLPIRPDLSYLDVGCGAGDIALALAQMGAGKVTGLDFTPRNICSANANVESLRLHDRVDFVCRDVHDWNPPHRYNVVLSHEALEHIRDPRNFLARLNALVADDGIAVLAFGPLFRSPFGDHMDGFFRLQIPWRGVLFSEQAILRLRRLRFRPSDTASRYPEIVGGLNLLSYSDFLRDVAETGWQFEFLAVNPQLLRIPPAYWLSNTLIRVPVVRDYVASSVYTILRRANTSSRVKRAPERIREEQAAPVGSRTT
jgi:SAM-dependent methyltransferase